METRIGRLAWPWVAGTLGCVLGLTAGAQEGTTPQQPRAALQVPAPSATPGGAPAVPAGTPDSSDAAPPAQPPAAGQAPPPAAGPLAAEPAATPDEDAEADEARGAARAAAATAPTPFRAPSAVMRVLDKVTAETMAFDAPIGRRVRFKSLVFEVKACETRDTGEPQPQPAAYLLITSDAGVSIGPVAAPRQVFKGWMFADAPDVHAVRHPVYDAWLVSCSAAAPPT